MNKTTKGALAAGAAGALLLGGLGTLAFWTDTETIDGTDIDSGHLQLVDGNCGAGWVLDGGATYAGQVLVPGDTLTQICSYTVKAEGEHLKASFDATDLEVTGDAALLAEVAFTDEYTVDDVAVGNTDVAIEDGDVVKATLKITWPHGVENNGSNELEGLEASLADVVVVATQAHDAS